MQSVIQYYRALKFSLKQAFIHTPMSMTALFFFSAIRGIVPYLNSFLLGSLVNTIAYGLKNNSSKLFYLLVLYALVNAMPAILGNIISYIQRLRMLKFQMEIDLMFLRKREELDIATHENPEFQDLMQRSFGSGSGIGSIFQLTNSQFNVVTAIASFTLGTVLAVNFSFFIYAVIILSAIPAFITDIRYAGFGWSIWAKASPEQRRLDDLRQHLRYKTPLIEVKLLQAGQKILGQIRKIFVDFSNKQRNLEKNRLWATSFTDIVALLGFAGGLFLIIKNVSSANLQVGTFVYVIGTLTNIRSSITNLLNEISGQFENCLVINDLITFNNTKPLIVESQKPEKLDLVSPPEIIFENVGFKYGNSNKWSLKNVNLTFRAGDNIGLVGNNGAGKTTLVKLLCRVYDPTEGRILVNGIDLKDLSTNEWWSYLAVMFQDYADYDFTVEDAIAIGRPSKPNNLTKVIEAAKIGQAHDFIMDWEGKYSQQLGSEFGGKEPSKGQRQKLSISKILYRNGLVMILDEPTASVDAESESKIFDSIENLSKDQTAILISHDFSTISACDRIFVLDKGRLIEEGTHKELMKNKGMYSELYKLQADRFKK